MLSPLAAGSIVLAHDVSLTRDVALATGYAHQSFPQPLSKDQEREYFSKWQQGDKQAYHQLIEHNLRLVAHVANTS